MRRTIGVGTEDDESENAPLGFDPATLDEVQTLWDPLTAGELLARVGHFLRIMSQMMEEVGYMAEILSRGHRPGPDPEHDATNLMQSMKRHLSAGDRRRSSGGGVETGGGDEEDTVEMPSSSTSAARTTTRRTTRHDPVPREENLTEEDWAIMRAVGRCPVWKTIKSFNLREREKLLAAICMILQETVEGNTEKRVLLIQWKISETGPGDGEKMTTTRSVHYRTSGTICYAILWVSRLLWMCGALRMLLTLGKILLGMGGVARLAYRETLGGPPRQARQQK